MAAPSRQPKRQRGPSDAWDDPAQQVLLASPSLAVRSDAALLARELGLQGERACARLEGLLASSLAASSVEAALAAAPEAGLCTFEQSGFQQARQPLLRCLTCAADRVCVGCARSCHAGHAMCPLPDGPAAGWCQCGAGGRCSARNMKRQASLAAAIAGQDAPAVAAVAEALLCWGAGDAAIRDRLASVADHLGFVPVADLLAMCCQLAGCGQGVGVSSLASALQKHRLCRFAKYGSATVMVQPRHPHSHAVIHFAAAAIAAADGGAAADDDAVELERAVTLPERVSDAVLLQAASLSASTRLELPRAWSGGSSLSAGGRGALLSVPVPIVEAAAGAGGAARALQGILRRCSPAGVAGSAARASAEMECLTCAGRAGRPDGGRARAGDRTGDRGRVLALPGPAEIPGEAGAAAARLRRLEQQRAASAAAGARLAGGAPVVLAPASGSAEGSAAGSDEYWLSWSAGAGADSAQAAASAIASPEAVRACPARVTVLASGLSPRGSGGVVACGSADEAAEWARFEEAARAAGRVGVSAVRGGSTGRIHGLAVAVAGGAAGVGQGALGTPTGDAAMAARGVQVLVAGFDPRSAAGAVADAETGSRRGADPVGDRTAMQPALPILLDARVTKLAADLGNLCADLSAQAGLFLVNAEVASGCRAPGRGSAAGEASAAEAVRLLAGLGLVDGAVGAVAAAVRSAAASAAGWAPPAAVSAESQLARASAQLLCLSAADADWGKAGCELPPLTHPPWYLACKRCRRHGHFDFECPG